MGIGELKRWQWAGVGLIAGALLAYGRPPGDPTEGVRSAGAEQFEQELGREPLRSGAPFVADIVVYPSGEGGYLVRFDWLTPSKESQGWRYVPWCMDAGKVYASKLDPTAGQETVLGFLERMSKKNPHVRYRYAWWAEARWWYVLWVGGGVVVVGGIWPFVLMLLAGGGVAGEEEGYVFPVGAGEGEAGVAAPGGGSAADGERLAEVNRELEESLGGAAGADGGGNAPESPGAAPAVVALNGGPVEDAPEPDEERARREYAGEFYPVARQGQRKDEPAEGEGHDNRM